MIGSGMTKRLRQIMIDGEENLIPAACPTVSVTGYDSGATTITGSGFGATQQDGTIEDSANGSDYSACTVVSWSATSITVDAGITDAYVRITNWCSNSGVGEINPE